jgi:hypothetical protein
VHAAAVAQPLYLHLQPPPAGSLLLLLLMLLVVMEPSESAVLARCQPAEPTPQSRAPRMRTSCLPALPQSHPPCLLVTMLLLLVLVLVLMWTQQGLPHLLAGWQAQAWPAKHTRCIMSEGQSIDKAALMWYSALSVQGARAQQLHCTVESDLDLERREPDS